MPALPARRRRRLRALFTFLEALSQCLPTPASCGGASETPWQRGRRQFASVIASDAMVAWLAVTKQGCQWCHSGAAGGSWLLLVLLVVELGWRRWPRKDACADDPIRSTGWSFVDARVDDPIRLSGVSLRLMSMTQSDRWSSIEARVDDPIRSDGVLLRLVSMTQSD